MLGLLIGLIILGCFIGIRAYCAQSIDRQRAIITVPARSPSATKTLVKYELRQELARLRAMTPPLVCAGLNGPIIGLYRENAIATESEARDPCGGNVYYVPVQITFPIPEFACKEH